MTRDVSMKLLVFYSEYDTCKRTFRKNHTYRNGRVRLLFPFTITIGNSCEYLRTVEPLTPPIECAEFTSMLRLNGAPNNK